MHGGVAALFCVFLCSPVACQREEAEGNHRLHEDAVRSSHLDSRLHGDASVKDSCTSCAQRCVSSERAHPECSCFRGFRQLAEDPTKCHDVDECLRDPRLCKPGGRCINTVGSFVCRCSPGYQVTSRGQCMDVDECARTINPCPQLCTNTQGSFSCSCSRGYSLLDSRCEDVDECELQVDGCSHLCVNTQGSYICRCPAPLQLAEDARTCVQNAKRPRALRENSNLCPFSCLNGGSCKHGECHCPAGVTGKICQNDIDECLLLPVELSCAHRCVNTFGSFQCECEPGFMLGADRRSCSPVTCSPPCMNGGSCVAGTCECSTGFTGPVCALDVDECESSPCQHLCRNTLGSFVCLCRSRWRLAADQRTCLEPPCLPHCRHGGVCRGGRCHCKPGFHGRLCQLDVNECSSQDSPCKHACVNSFGSYQCLCPPGLRLSENRTTCLQDPPSDDEPRERERVDVMIEIVVEDSRARKTHHTMQHMDIQLPWPPYPSKHAGVHYKLIPQTLWYASHSKPSIQSSLARQDYFNLHQNLVYSTAIIPSQEYNNIQFASSQIVSVESVSSSVVQPGLNLQSPSEINHVDIRVPSEDRPLLHTPVLQDFFNTRPSSHLPGFNNPTISVEITSSKVLPPSDVVNNEVGSPESTEKVSQEKAADLLMSITQRVTSANLPDVASDLLVTTEASVGMTQPESFSLSEAPPITELMDEEIPIDSSLVSAPANIFNNDTLSEPVSELREEEEVDNVITPILTPNVLDSRNLLPDSKQERFSVESFDMDNIITPTLPSSSENVDLLQDIAHSLFPAQNFIPTVSNTSENLNPYVNSSDVSLEPSIMSSPLLEQIVTSQPLSVEETPDLNIGLLSSGIIATSFHPQEKELLMISSTAVLPQVDSETLIHKKKRRKNKNKLRKQKESKIGKDLQILNQILQSFDLQPAKPGDGRQYEVIDLDAVTSAPVVSPSKVFTDSHPLPTRQTEWLNRTETDCYYNRKKYKSRSSFYRDDKNCTKCVCKDGELRCAPRHCPPPHCESPLHGDCCDYCPGDCVVEQQVYLPGERFSPYLDPCRECRCEAGRPVCHDVICPPLNCPEQYRALVPDECCPACIPPEPGCFWNGRFFYTGQLWVRRQGGCHACLCKESGEVQCNPVVCVVGCQHPQFVPGDCCPLCEGCQHHGHKYEHQQTFQHPSDPCSSCQCLYGNITCFERTCQSNCSHPYKPSGKCCPECSDCMFEEEHIKHGHIHYSSSEDGVCKECTCQSGEVSCRSTECLPGCEVEGGKQVASGTHFSLGSDPCTRCRCSEGKVECRAEPCPVQCSHGVLLSGSCCLDCTHCDYKGRIYQDLQVFRPESEPCMSCLCARGNVLCQDTCEEASTEDDDEDEEEDEEEE